MSDLSHSRARLAPAFCIALVAVLNLGFYSMNAPTTRALELSACCEYYRIYDPSVIQPGDFVDEDLCKVTVIQKRVAWLLALLGILHFCCDRVGRKPILFLNIGGLTISWAWTVFVCYFRSRLSTNLVLLGPLFALTGGATHFNTALIYGEAAVFTSQNNRTALFSFLEATIQISQLIGPVIGSSLMQISVFTPFLVSFALFLISFPLVFLLPRHEPTRSGMPNNKKRPDDANLDEASPSRPLLDNRTSSQYLTADSCDTAHNGSVDEDAELLLLRDGKPDTLRSRFLGTWQNLLDFAILFIENPIAQYTLAAFLVVTLGKQSLHILLQYVSKCFGTTIAEAGYLFSIKAGVVMVIFGVVLPCAKRIKSVPVQRTNVWLAKGSILALTIGVLLMGLAWSVWSLIPGLVIYASGFGFSTLMRTLVTASVAEEQIGQLYSGLALAETVGSMAGALFVTAAFTWSVGTGGWIAGIPFYACSFFYGCIAISTWIVGLEKDRKQRI